jgi:hypothetical protein
VGIKGCAYGDSLCVFFYLFVVQARVMVFFVDVKLLAVRVGMLIVIDTFAFRLSLSIAVTGSCCQSSCVCCFVCGRVRESVPLLGLFTFRVSLLIDDFDICSVADAGTSED